MNRDDIIRMAREAGWSDELLEVSFTAPLLDRFAALVAAEKEQQMIRDGWRQCAKGQRTTQFCGLLEAAVKAGREALKTYGQHRNNCAVVLGGYQCTCGFNQQEQLR